MISIQQLFALINRLRSMNQESDWGPMCLVDIETCISVAVNSNPTFLKEFLAIRSALLEHVQRHGEERLTGFCLDIAENDLLHVKWRLV